MNSILFKLLSNSLISLLIEDISFIIILATSSFGANKKGMSNELISELTELPIEQIEIIRKVIKIIR